MKDQAALIIICLTVLIVVGMLHCNHRKETVVDELSEGKEAEMDALCNETPQEKLVDGLEKAASRMCLSTSAPDTVPMPKYVPRTIEDCIDHLVEGVSFEELLIWADWLGVPPGEKTWHKSEWADRESDLRSEVGEVLGALK